MPPNIVTLTHTLVVPPHVEAVPWVRVIVATCVVPTNKLMVFAEAMGAMANAATRTRAKIESLKLSLRTTKVPPWGRYFVLQ